jgi:hypothetical protein
MSQNQEIIESKLCAYIDGELDPEGRAEIEKHLEANPQHRRLLESLRATRDLIRWLPREPAPPEVAETLSGQLERSVLLNYEGDSLRTSPWPRIFAAAAIILLTAGLGAAVYYALPRSQKPAQLALHSATTDNTGDVVPAPATSEARSDSIDSSETGHGVYREMDKMKPGGPEDLKKDGPALASKMSDQSKQLAGTIANNTSNNSAMDLDQLAEQVGQNPAAFLASAENANTASNVVAQNAAPAASNAMVLLVRSNAPEQTEKQLTSYLNQQQIQWRRPAAPQPDNLAVQQNLQQEKLGMASKDNGLKLSDQDRDAGQNRSDARYLADSAKNSDVAAKGGYSSGLAARPTPAAVPATTQLTQAGTLNDPQFGNVQQQVAGGGALGNSAQSNGLYVCQMSRRQAEELSTTISSDTLQRTQVQNVYGLAFNNNLAERNATQNSIGGGQPPAQAGARGGAVERERMSRGELQSQSGSGFGQPVDSTLQKAELTPPTRPAGAGADAPNAAIVSGKAAMDAATTQPALAPAGALAVAPGATQPSAGALATTTAPADEPMNVVIMVQQNAADAAAAPGASTQPVQESFPQKARAPVEQQQPILK